MEKHDGLIDAIVKYSKDCILMRFVKNHLKKSLFLTKRLPFQLRTSDTISLVMEELDNRLNEREGDIKLRITPLFEGKDFNYGSTGKFSLSKSEIEDGFILLKEVARREKDKVISYKDKEFIIFLRPFDDKETGLNFAPGVLYEIGSSFPEESLKDIPKSKESFLDNDILNLIIKKPHSYEYIE